MVSQPPSSGPSAAAAPATAPHTPNAIPRARPVKVPDTIERVEGEVMAAPKPCTARAAISISMLREPPASDRAEHEHGDAGDEDALPPDLVADAAPGDDERGKDQRVDRIDPLELLERGIELALDRWDGNVDDRAVDDDDGQAQAEHQQRQPLAPGDPVARCAGVRAPVRRPGCARLGRPGWAAAVAPRVGDSMCRSPGLRLRVNAVKEECDELLGNHLGRGREPFRLADERVDQAQVGPARGTAA